MKRWLLISTALVACASAHAQNAVLQQGPWKAGDLPAYSSSGSSVPVITDSGISSSLGLGPSLSGNNVWTGSNAFAGPVMTIPGVVCDANIPPSGPPTGTDNTAAINAVLSSAAPYTHILLPAGICLVSGTLNAAGRQHISFGGQGKNATTVLYYNPAATTKDIIYVGGTSGPAGSNYITIHDLQVLTATTMTGGSVLHLQFCTYCWVQNFDFDEYNGAKTVWDGIWADQPGWVTVRDYLIRGAQDDDARVSGGKLTGGWNYDVFFLGGKIGAAGHAGFHIGGGIDGVHLSNSELTSSNINLLVDHSIVAYKNQEWAVEGSYLDQATTNNIVIDDNLCNIANYGIGHIGGNITHADHGANILVKSWPNCQLVIDAALITQAQDGSVGDGITVEDQSALLFISSETQITENARYGIASTLSDGTTGAFFNNLYSGGQIYSNSGGATNGRVAWTRVGMGPINQVSIASGFGTGALIESGYTTQGFVINVGTGGSASAGVLTMPQATYGWMCLFNAPADHTSHTVQTGNDATSVTLTNYDLVSGAYAAWGSGDTIAAQCRPR